MAVPAAAGYRVIKSLIMRTAASCASGSAYADMTILQLRGPGAAHVPEAASAIAATAYLVRA